MLLQICLLRWLKFVTYSSRFLYPIDGYHVYAIAEALEIPQILNEQV